MSGEARAPTPLEGMVCADAGITHFSGIYREKNTANIYRKLSDFCPYITRAPRR
jgi:hypothetical protein